jgi:hypothetical protein
MREAMTKEQRKFCFVIGPIGSPGSDTRKHADWLLQGIIKPVFKEYFSDYEVIRADQIVAPGNINSQVINRLWDSQLVIADMSQHNANAFYELAIRHLNGLPTIHMIHQSDEIPFDNAPYRAIKFSYSVPSELELARAELKSVVEEAIKPGFVSENPITHARGLLELQQHATPPQRVLLDALSQMERRLTALERTGTGPRIRREDVAPLIAQRENVSAKRPADEPTMEEILASIRRIIAEDDAAKKS